MFAEKQIPAKKKNYQHRKKYCIPQRRPSTSTPVGLPETCEPQNDAYKRKTFSIENALNFPFGNQSYPGVSNRDEENQQQQYQQSIPYQQRFQIPYQHHSY